MAWRKRMLAVAPSESRGGAIGFNFSGAGNTEA
jgi:hypothetical protein